MEVSCGGMERAKVPGQTIVYPINLRFPQTRNRQRKISQCSGGKEEGEYPNAQQNSTKEKHDEWQHDSIVQIKK